MQTQGLKKLTKCVWPFFFSKIPLNFAILHIPWIRQICKIDPLKTLFLTKPCVLLISLVFYNLGEQPTILYFFFPFNTSHSNLILTKTQIKPHHLVYSGWTYLCCLSYNMDKLNNMGFGHYGLGYLGSRWFGYGHLKMGIEYGRMSFLRFDYT